MFYICFILLQVIGNSREVLQCVAPHLRRECWSLLAFLYLKKKSRIGEAGGKLRGTQAGTALSKVGQNPE